MKHKEKNDNGLNFLNLMIIISLKSSENQKQNACTEIYWNTRGMESVYVSNSRMKKFGKIQMTKSDI